VVSLDQSLISKFIPSEWDPFVVEVIGSDFNLGELGGHFNGLAVSLIETLLNTRYLCGPFSSLLLVVCLGAGGESRDLGLVACNEGSKARLASGGDISEILFEDWNLISQLSCGIFVS